MIDDHDRCEWVPAHPACPEQNPGSCKMVVCVCVCVCARMCSVALSCYLNMIKSAILICSNYHSGNLTLFQSQVVVKLAVFSVSRRSNFIV